MQPTTLPTYDPTTPYPTRNDRYKAAGYSIISDDERNAALTKLNEALYNNCAWICAGQYYLDANDPNSTVEVSSKNKPNVTKNVLKPTSYDTAKGGCDCSLYELPPNYTNLSS